MDNSEMLKVLKSISLNLGLIAFALWFLAVIIAWK